MTYTWNFGDGSPVSRETSPTHSYARAGNYQVTLTAISKYGCSRLITQEISISSSDPLAGLALQESVCQYEAASFFDKSEVSFGESSSWYWDFNRKGSSTEQDPVLTFPPPGRKTITLKTNSSATCFE